MQRVTVVCVGKLKERFYAEAAAEYVKRLGRYCRLELVELPEQRLPENPSPAEIERALAREAEAIRAKGIAEAEAMEKKAEAYQKYNNAAMAEMLIKVLPDIAGKIAEPLTQIDKITIIGGGGQSDGVSSVADNVPAVMAKLFETMKDTVGIDLADIVKAGTYDAKVNRHISITTDDGEENNDVDKVSVASSEMLF